MRVARKTRSFCRRSGRAWVLAQLSRHGGSGGSGTNTPSSISDSSRSSLSASYQKVSLSTRLWHKYLLASCLVLLHRVLRVRQVRSTTTDLPHLAGCPRLMVMVLCHRKDICTLLHNRLDTMAVTCRRKEPLCRHLPFWNIRLWHNNPRAKPSHP